MAKKNLLSETQIRRFQSLANISALNEMGSYNKKDEEEMEEGMYGKPKKDEEEMEEAMDSKKDDEEVMEETTEATETVEEEMDMPEKEMEMDMDMPEADPDGDGDLDLDMKDAEALIRLADQLKQMLKMEPGEEPEMDMDMNEPVGEPAADMMGEAEELEEALAGVNFVPEQADIVQEVARRVAKRLARAKKHQQALDEALGNK